MNLRRQRCEFHPDREAAARCPGCQRHFCRECVTEHTGALYCLPCLDRIAGNHPPAPGRRTWAVALLLLALALLLQAGLFLLLLRPLANLAPPATPPSQAAL